MERYILKVTRTEPDGSPNVQNFGPFTNRELAFAFRVDLLQRGFEVDLEYVDPVADMRALLKQSPELYTSHEAWILGSGMADEDHAALISRHDTPLARRYTKKG